MRRSHSDPSTKHRSILCVHPVVDQHRSVARNKRHSVEQIVNKLRPAERPHSSISSSRFQASRLPSPRIDTLARPRSVASSVLMQPAQSWATQSSKQHRSTPSDPPSLRYGLPDPQARKHVSRQASRLVFWSRMCRFSALGGVRRFAAIPPRVGWNSTARLRLARTHERDGIIGNSIERRTPCPLPSSQS